MSLLPLILPLHFAGLVFQIRQIDREDPISFSLQLIHTYAFATSSRVHSTGRPEDKEIENPTKEMQENTETLRGRRDWSVGIF